MRRTPGYALCCSCLATPWLRHPRGHDGPGFTHRFSSVRSMDSTVFRFIKTGPLQGSNAQLSRCCGGLHKLMIALGLCGTQRTKPAFSLFDM